MVVKNVEEILVHLYNQSPISGEYCYRGQANSKWKLTPTIHRGNLKRYEAVIAEAFLLYFLNDKRFPKAHVYTHHPIELLAMCQHYGIPTRFLDWSNNILVSLFFACDGHIENDGALFLCKKDWYKRFDFSNFNETTKYPLFIDTHIVNPRLQSQSGSFMIWGKLPLNSETTETYTLVKYNSYCLEENPIQKLIIPKEMKDQLLDELNDKYGINMNSIYLDNEFSRTTENEYKRFKEISDIIVNEITGSDERNSAFNLNFNLAGCLNLQSLPEEAPDGFTNVISLVIKKFNL